MKQLLSILVLLLLFSISVLSCKDKAKTVNTDDSIKAIVTAPTVNKDSYQPGEEWKLIWGDEFKADTINTNNWNFQVVEAGRFNDEWQRYTNSNKNAYIDVGNLIIKAIHESKTLTNLKTLVLKEGVEEDVGLVNYSRPELLRPDDPNSI